MAAKGELEIRPIDGASALPPEAGGKARGLAEIARAGLPLPAAWAVLPGASDGAVAALAAALASRGISRVAVRSSAGDEDGGQHSFAGIHETELGVPVDRLREAIARVAASPLGDRAAAYRRQRGLAPAGGPCAVVVQEMVDAEWAGVAFGKGRSVLVEAVVGLGETAVCGDATPEQVELVGAGATFRVARRWPRRQPFALRVTPGGVERVALDGARPALSEASALGIARGVAVLEEALGRPLDVEWAVRGGRIAFLQARPQTRPLDAGLPAGERWTRTNVGDTFPEIPSAWSRSSATAMLDRVMREVYRLFGDPVPAEIPLATVVAGRLVFNERAVYGVGDRLGVPRSWVKVVIGGIGEGSNAYVPASLGSLLRNAGFFWRVSRAIRGAERLVVAYLAHLAEVIQRAPSPPRVREWTPALLHAERSRLASELDVGVLHVCRVAGAFQSALANGAMVLRRHPAPAALLARLLDPEVLSVSTLQLEGLVELARSMRRWEGAAAFLATADSAQAGRAHWQASLPAGLWAEIERWLAAFGHRGPYESDLAQPRYGDDLRLLAAALRPLVTGPEEPEPVDVRRARRRADWAAAWREADRVAGPLGRLLLRGPVATLGRLMQVREALRSEMTRWAMAERASARAAGSHLVAAERLDAASDVFHLDMEEYERALFDPAFDARAAVARERARIAAWRRIEVPHHFASEEVAGFGRRGATVAEAAATLTGTAVSPGVAEGRVSVLRTPEDEAGMALGGILVAHTTDPGWTPLFGRAAGIVVELGGVMSHAATVAREYGLPCVSNVDGAVAKLRDGDLLRVDGTHGTVEVLERAPHGAPARDRAD